MSKSKKVEFTFTVNDGEEQSIKVKSGIYVEAVAAIPAIIGIDQDAYPLTIKIWVPDLLPDYGPYTYYIERPGAAAGFVTRFWDGQDRAVYSTG